MVSGSEKFDCDAPRQMQILGEINRAHSAFAKFFENSIMGDCLADHARLNPSGCERETWFGRELHCGHCATGLQDFQDFRINYKKISFSWMGAVQGAVATWSVVSM